MFYNGTFTIFVVLACMAGWLVSTWIKARYGYPLEDGAGNTIHRHGAAPGHAGEARNAQAASSTDEAVAALERRVRVLERIVTDRGQTLSDEIERLRT